MMGHCPISCLRPGDLYQNQDISSYLHRQRRFLNAGYSKEDGKHSSLDRSSAMQYFAKKRRQDERMCV
jgi:hypothetical protein